MYLVRIIGLAVCVVIFIIALLNQINIIANPRQYGNKDRIETLINYALIGVSISSIAILLFF